jgi:hypothetical protein
MAGARAPNNLMSASSGPASAVSLQLLIYLGIASVQTGAGWPHGAWLQALLAVHAQEKTVCPLTRHPLRFSCRPAFPGLCEALLCASCGAAQANACGVQPCLPRPPSAA